MRVRVATEQEYPVLAIWEVGNPAPGDGFDIPYQLWQDLRRAHAREERAEMAIMTHIAERNEPAPEEVSEP